MLIHEWIKYRNEQVQQAAKQKGTEDDAAVAPGLDAQALGEDAEGTIEHEALRSLQEELGKTSDTVRERLAQLQARQRQLPIDVEEAEDEPEAIERRRASETREQLVQRLLDPTLTIRECALLLGVCATTVRRYTNRGLLKCFRTAGNQRRFRLSDVLEFMEGREREAE